MCLSQTAGGLLWLLKHNGEKRREAKRRNTDIHAIVRKGKEERKKETTVQGLIPIAIYVAAALSPQRGWDGMG